MPVGWFSASTKQASPEVYSVRPGFLLALPDPFDEAIRRTSIVDGRDGSDPNWVGWQSSIRGKYSDFGRIFGAREKIIRFGEEARKQFMIVCG